MSDIFKLGPISVKRGTRGYGTLPVTTMASGYEVAVPVHVIAGSQPGPTVTIISMLHGHEYTAIDVNRQVVTKINPNDTKGTILAIPVANTWHFPWTQGVTG